MISGRKIKGCLLSFGLMLACFCPLSGQAQEAPSLSSDRDAPIEISAGQTLEWHRNTKKYIARGQVVTRQGAVEIHSETLTADYKDGKDNAMDIWRLTADGQVHIRDGDNAAYGKQAVYNVEKGLAVMTGGDLKLVSPGQVITARDRLEYWTVKGEASAIGDAKVVQGEDSLQAGTIKAFFKKDAQGKQTVDRLEAIGNVVIRTPEETLYGDKGVYNGATDTAELTGNVRIERGPNRLEGARAEVNLTTNISKMFGGGEAGSNGRVRGVFYPGSEKKEKTQAGPDADGTAVTP